jgi:hypothetical protein
VDAVSVVQRYFDAWRRGDVEHLRSLLDDQVLASGPLATVRGAQEHAMSLVRSRPLFRDIVVDQLLTDGQFVIAWFRFELPSGSSVRAANRCEIVGGVISNIEVAFDPRPLIAEPATGDR